jgi:hypothetical protein
LLFRKEISALRTVNNLIISGGKRFGRELLEIGFVGVVVIAEAKGEIRAAKFVGKRRKWI